MSYGCSDINVMSLFNTNLRHERSHWQKQAVKCTTICKSLSGSFNDILSHLYYLPWLNSNCLLIVLNVWDIMHLTKDEYIHFLQCKNWSVDIHLFKQVRLEPLHDEKRKILSFQFQFSNIEMYAINIRNVRHHKLRR